MIELACEFLAFWLGGTHRPELARISGHRPRRLSDLLQDGFARRGRPTVAYDACAKRFLPVQKLEAEHLHGVRSPDEVMTTLLAVQAWHRGGTPPFPCPVLSTSQFRRQPSAEIFRILLAGCARRRPVHIRYRARSRELAATFSPHTLVQTAQRLHLRGYSLEAPDKGRYWDLLPARVTQAELGKARNYVDGAGDTEWREQAMLRIALVEDVPASMRAAIRQEHCMRDDVLDIGPMPKALLPYVQAEYTHRRYQGYPHEVWQRAHVPGGNGEEAEKS